MNPDTPYWGFAQKVGLTPSPWCRWSVLAGGVVLIVVAWLIAQWPPITKVGNIDDISVIRILIWCGAVPWFLQWAGITCAIVWLSGSRLKKEAVLFAIASSLLIGVIWWSGLVFRTRGQDFLHVVLDVTTSEIQSQSGSSSDFDLLLFHVVGPILNPIQLRGPFSLHGWNFCFVALSTVAVVGYLTVVGRRYIGNGQTSVTECVKFVAAILPLFLPPLVQLGVRIMNWR